MATRGSSGGARRKSGAILSPQAPCASRSSTSRRTSSPVMRSGSSPTRQWSRPGCRATCSTAQPLSARHSSTTSRRTASRRSAAVTAGASSFARSPIRRSTSCCAGIQGTISIAATPASSMTASASSGVPVRRGSSNPNWR